MSDLQLAILLRQFSSRLANLIGVAQVDLPEECVKKKKNALFPRVEDSYYPVMDDLWSFQHELDSFADRLEQSNG